MTNPRLSLSPVIPARASLIVGVSGGCDSIALLRLLIEHLPHSADRLVVAHVNYGLRGKQSETDEMLVRYLCDQWRLPLRILKVRDMKKKIKKSKRSLQDEARELRYSFFQETVKEEKAWGVVVAHHLEDQAETVLDRFLRGSGAKGISGLREIQSLTFDKKQKPLQVWRPLLRATKGSLEDFLETRGIPWREDKSNQKLDYRRNQIRHQVLPFLKKWNERLVDILGRMGEVTSVEDEFVGQLLEEASRKLQNQWTKRTYFCTSASFHKMHLALRRRWVRLVAERMNPDARGISFDRVEEILRIWKGEEKGPRDIGYGLSAGKDKTSLYLKNLGLPKR